MNTLSRPGPPTEPGSRMPLGARLAPEARTMACTGLPRQVSACRRGLGPCVRPRHHLVCSWLVGLQRVDGAPAILAGGEPSRPSPSGFPARPSPAQRRLWVDEAAAVVVGRASCTGLSAPRGGFPRSRRRQPPPRHTRGQASRGAEHAPAPASSVGRGVSERPPHGALGDRSSPGGVRPGPAPGRSQRPARTCPVSPETASVPSMMR